ncbi:hypothetical protein [Nocardia wallacei]|uniref:Uncharacterized protein n=1 Tax=Nocardia wallacei TaxID=480035 RepID=A0A7G1KZL6_9NOCA|nr:hypothetical protein [Nocardia wallacei]BCK59459.1 hypothetical protein NWFMUON74_72310 [Nocardia wallacei]
MPDQESRTWTFIDTVSVSPSMVSSVDSVVILTNADNPFSPLHGGWISDVDRARASAVTLAQAARIRLRPAVSNHQFRLVAPRPQQRADGDVPEVQGVRLPAPGEPGGSSIEVRIFWAGMQLLADTRDRITSQQAETIERAFRATCGAGFYARSTGIAESVILESLTDVAELAELLLSARDSRAATTISVGGGHDDEPARAVGFLASGLPSAVTIEMREQ